MGGNSDWRTFTASDWLKHWHLPTLLQSIVEQNVVQYEFRTERVRNFSSQPEPCFGQRVEWEIVMPCLREIERERESWGSREFERKSVRKRKIDENMSTCLTTKMSASTHTWRLQDLRTYGAALPKMRNKFSLTFCFHFILLLHRHARTRMCV